MSASTVFAEKFAAKGILPRDVRLNMALARQNPEAAPAQAEGDAA